MAVFNNGSITASVTPPQGFTGSYRYTLYKYDQSIGDWAEVSGIDEGFTGTFINPTITVDTTHVFGNPGGSEENVEGDPDSWVGLVPGNYKVKVEAIGTECVVETTSTVGTQDPGDPEFTCSDTSITIPNGTVGDTVTATATNGVVGIITPSEYQNGTQSYDVEITVPSNYSNVGSIVTCTASATGTPALTEFTCTDANFQVADGTTGQDVVATVDTGTLNSVSPAQYVDGSATYTANITVPATGYSNAGATLTTCTDTATGEPALAPFICSNTSISIANGTAGDAIPTSAVTATGVSNIIAVYEEGTTTPATYIDGTQPVDVVFEVPTGYSNTGDSFTCSVDATGSIVTTEERTWYYFHGVDDDWLRMTGGGLLDASSYGLFNNGTYTGTAVGTLTEAMAHYFANSASLSNGMDIGQFEMNESITGNGEATQIVFNELINGEGAALYYLLIPNNSLFTENLVTDNLTIFPYPGLAGNAADRQPLQIDGVDYYIYLLQGSASIASRTCSFS